MVEAAIGVVQDEGLDALGISSVARALGIRPASMYNHVASGAALLRIVAEEGVVRLLEALKATVRGVVDPREQLRRLGHGIRDWAQTNLGLYRVIAQVEPDYSDADIPPTGRDLLDLFDRPLAQLGLAGPQRVPGIRALRSYVHGFVMLETTGQFQLGADIDESFVFGLEAVIAGVASV